MDSKAVVKPAIVLLLISAIAAGILGVVSEVTACFYCCTERKISE